MLGARIDEWNLTARRREAKDLRPTHEAEHTAGWVGEVPACGELAVVCRKSPKEGISIGSRSHGANMCGWWYGVLSRSMAQRTLRRRLARERIACLWFLPSLRLRW